MPDRHYHHHYHHWRGKDSYAYRAGSPGPGPGRHLLRRNTARGKVAGVCAGLADYFDWNVKWLRFGFIIGAVVPPFAPAGLILYGVLAILMKPRRDEERPIYASPEEERFWKTFSTRPRVTFSELKHRFRALDARIADLESAVVSDEYGLRKAFRDLERGA